MRPANKHGYQIPNTYYNTDRLEDRFQFSLVSLMKGSEAIASEAKWSSFV